MEQSAGHGGSVLLKTSERIIGPNSSINEPGKNPFVLAGPPSLLFHHL